MPEPVSVFSVFSVLAGDGDPFAHMRKPVVCDGCGEPGATETLTLRAPLGQTGVHVHKDRECAELARTAKGGGRFVTPRETMQERYQREAR